nr:MAG TPA_asm: hypothetical protein [Bacteriophage sp.]
MLLQYISQVGVQIILELSQLIKVFSFRLLTIPMITKYCATKMLCMKKVMKFSTTVIYSKEKMF